MPNANNLREPEQVKDRNTIRQDFDRIAFLSGDGWNHNSHYHPFLLRHLPPLGKHALDIGCGTGEFTRLLAGRSQRVTAIDLSPAMIQIARERSNNFPDIEYLVGDALEVDFPSGAFDCVATIATLHHMPLGAALEKMSYALAPGGVLLVLDLYQHTGIYTLLLDAAAVPWGMANKLVRTGHLSTPAPVRQAWREHSKHEMLVALDEVRRTAATLLPGACVRQHLLYRYSITWKKPISSIPEGDRP